MRTQIEGLTFKDLFRNTTPAGWILLARPVIYILFSRRRDLSAYSAIDTSALVFILYSFIAFYYGYKGIFSRESNFGKDLLYHSPLVWFVAYTALGVISMIWSINPILTGFRAFECLAMLLLLVTVISELFQTKNISYVFLWSLFYATWDIGWSILRTAQWARGIGDLLESSQMFATTFFFLALYFRPWKWYNILVMIMSIFSMSTVSYIGMGLGAISGFWTKGKTKILSFAVAFIVLLSCIAIGPYTILKNTIFFDKSEISLEETSGRNHLMDVTINTIEEHPLGLGFFSAEPYILYAHNLGAISAHNSIFSAGMGMGIPGVLTMVAFIISIGLATFSKYIDFEYRPIIIGCFCVALLQCMGNPSVGTRVFGAWIPVMYMFVLISSIWTYRKFYISMYNDDIQTDLL